MSDTRWELPPSWTWTTLGEVATVVGGGTPSTSDPANFGGNIPWITPADMSTHVGKHISSGSRSISEKGLNDSGARWLPTGSVLFSSRAPIGYTAIAAQPVTTNQGFKSFVPHLGINSDFLYYWLTGAKSIAEELASGTTFLELSGAKAALLPIPLAPTTEQTRIVAKLEELLSDLDAGVADLKAAQAKLTQYRQSLLKAAVEGALTADWRARRVALETTRPAQPADAENSPRPTEFHASFAAGQRRRHETPPTGGCAVQEDSADGFETGAQLLARILTERRARWEARQLARFESQGKSPPKGWQSKYPEPVAPDTRDLPELPEGWVWASLDMLGEIASGVAKGSKLKAGLSVREVPYLRVANVQRGYLDLSEIKTIEATESDIEELALKNGDVLFNEGGDRDKLGRGWVWRDEIPECIHQNHVFRMRPWLNAINSEFISHHGNSFGKRWFQRAGKQTTNLASINLSILRAFPVPVPPPAEQEAIITQLSEQLAALEIQVAEVELSMKQSAAQRQNLLKAAFSGQLVPQDPADEPASVLLERIRAERESHDNTTRRSRRRAATTS